jgi:hypothetical protein
MDSGDRIRAASWENTQEDSQEVCWVQYTHLLDLLAHQPNQPVVDSEEATFGRLDSIISFELLAIDGSVIEVLRARVDMEADDAEDQLQALEALRKPRIFVYAAIEPIHKNGSIPDD